MRSSSSSSSPSSSWSPLNIELSPYLPILTVFCLYSIALTMIFPALPTLLLKLTQDDASRASEIYGTATFLKFALEFFSASLLGGMSDRLGRKPILLLSLTIISIEFVLLACFPSLTMLYVTRALSGAGDATVAVTYATISDIAYLNDDFVTREFGRVGAAFGVGVVIGPILGAFLTVEGGLTLCFLGAAAVVVIAIIVTLMFFLETTSLIAKAARDKEVLLSDTGYQSGVLMSALPIDPVIPDKSLNSYRAILWQKLNPFVPIATLFSNSELRVLSYPFMLSQISSGIHYIWIIYLKERFDASSLDIGLFFAISGAVVVVVQGYLIKSLIPIRLTEESASVLCLLLSCVQLLFFGLCPSMMSFYVVVVLFAPASIYSPALKALLSNAAGATKQGELQGALSGLRTISAGLGALLFSWVYSFSGGAIANAAHSHNGLTPTTSLSLTSEEIDMPEKFASLNKMMTLSSSFVVSPLHHDSSYSEYVVFALEEGFPFFVAAWFYFIAFLFMLYYVRNLAAFKGSTLSQHSLTRGRYYGSTIGGLGSHQNNVQSELSILTRQTTGGSSSRLLGDDEEDDENQLFYKI